tara:strand:- start:150 stop:521 length:372 start_codon:yes stop_codon:yes gene_type:complete
MAFYSIRKDNLFFSLRLRASARNLFSTHFLSSRDKSGVYFEAGFKARYMKGYAILKLRDPSDDASYYIDGYYNNYSIGIPLSFLYKGNLRGTKILFTNEFEPHLIRNRKKSLIIQTISTSDTN